MSYNYTLGSASLDPPASSYAVGDIVTINWIAKPVTLAAPDKRYIAIRPYERANEDGAVLTGQYCGLANFGPKMSA